MESIKCHSMELIKRIKQKEEVIRGDTLGGRRFKDQGEKILVRLFPVYRREIMIAIGVISVLLIIQVITWEKPVKIRELARPGFMEGNEEVRLYYDYGKVQGEGVLVEVPALDIEQGQIQNVLEQRSREVSELIEKQLNQYSVINKRLALVNKYKECMISYTFYPKELINKDGWFHTEAFGEEEDLIIGYTLEISDEEGKPYTYDHQLTIPISKDSFTLDYEKAYSEYLMNMYQETIHKSQAEVINLPMGFTFYDKKPTGLVLYMSGVMGAVIVFLILISNLENTVTHLENKGKRKNNLTYFINNFLILYRTGMTISKSFTYALHNRIQAIDPKEPIYEELVKLQNYMTGNPNLVDSLNQFVQIFDSTHGHRFKRLLLQNEKQGDDQLVNQLEYMTAGMWDKRIRSARKEGERASSKLVFPMLLIFIVILILTIVPSFMEVESLL